MIDVGQVAAVVGSLKTAGEIASAMIGIRDQRLVDAKAAELLAVIVSAYDRAFAAQVSENAMLERVRTLEAELARMKEWDAGKGAYRLQAIGTGAFAYVSQPSPDREEPPHWLCVKCYDKRHKSILQQKGRSANDRTANIWACPECRSEIQVHWGKNPQSLATHQVEASND